MANLGALRALAQRMERVVPYRLSTDEARQFTKFAQQKYSPMARKLSDREFDLRMKFPEYDDAEQARVKEMIEQLSHEAARYSMLDHAASSIAKARLYGDEDLRARLIRDSNGIPGGIATYYPPSHFEGDPLAHGATYVEHLGATGEPGQGRVLLRGVGLENPTDPLILQSLNYPETTGFYEARGGWRVPYENQQGSALRSMSLPVFKWERGDAVKEKEGGSVKKQKFQVGGLARYFAKNAPKGLSAMSELGTHSAAPLGALSVVKQKGGNWLNGSVEDALERLKKADAAVLRGNLGTVEAPAVDQLQGRESAINQWIDKQLTRYVKNEMATPEDPIRALAERGVLHFDPGLQPGAAWIPNRQVLGQSELARNWEGASDQAIRTRTPYKDDFGAITLRDNPWLQKLEPNTPVHSAGNNLVHASEQLGFQHLIDELDNALNPASGLPRNFLLDARSLPRVSVPQMVQRVHDINQWRAAQQAEADALRANNAATKLVREYPENNPLGLRWVELGISDEERKTLPPGYTAKQTQNGWNIYRDEDGVQMFNFAPSLESISPNPYIRLREGTLKDALKYEGDTMGHCVGGYCDDVLSGRARIFSLRDAKGEPHVTVEVGNTPKDPRFDAPEQLQDTWSRQAHAEAQRKGIPDESEEYMEYVIGREQELANAWASTQNTPRIVQIKGKQNRKPNDEYLPFVQDFVRNSPLGGSWSDVGDLQNTGLTKHKTGKYITDAQAAALYEKHFGKLPDSSESAWQYANRIGRYDKNMLTEIDVDFLKDWEAGNFGD